MEKGAGQFGEEIFSMKQGISILLVEDLVEKQRTINAALSDRLKSFTVIFDFAARYESALEKLRTKNYDFVILDIKIPAGQEDPSEKWSRQLLRDILEGNLCYPMHVFGLTQHREIADAERQFYEENMFGFFLFDWSDFDWATKIAAKIEYLAVAIQNGSAYRLNSYDYDLLLLSARNKTEFAPIRTMLFGAQQGMGHPLWPDRSYFGQLSLTNRRKLRTAFLCIGETGLAPAASMATQAIHILRPRVVAMLGMCAGFETKGVKLLDVLIAREAACWQEGKSIGDEVGEKFDLRTKTKESSTELGKRIDRYLEMYDDEISTLLEKTSQSQEYLDLRQLYKYKMRKIPKARAGLIVSGSEVVASKKTRDEVMRRHPSALGLEMEIYAVYVAAKNALGKACEFIAIKGVADFADQQKKDATQKLASELSAKVLLYLLRKSH